MFSVYFTIKTWLEKWGIGCRGGTCYEYIDIEYKIVHFRGLRSYSESLERLDNIKRMKLYCVLRGWR